MRLYNRARIVARVEYVVRVAYRGACGVCVQCGVVEQRIVRDVMLEPLIVEWWSKDVRCSGNSAQEQGAGKGAREMIMKNVIDL